MTYYCQGIAIGQRDGETIFWRVLPRGIGYTMHEYGSKVAVQDSNGNRYSGDEFWYVAGDLAWDTSRVGQAVAS